MKKYVIMVSTEFPKSHKRAGDPTNFEKSILSVEPGEKIHTIRANYAGWKKKIESIQAGEGYLSVRKWSGKPYRSKQVEIQRFYDVGIEKVHVIDTDPRDRWILDEGGVLKRLRDKTLARNDGLSIGDFNEWFKHIEPPVTYAIIHFTDTRYSKHHLHTYYVQQ